MGMMMLFWRKYLSDFKYSLKNTVLKLANVKYAQSIKNENGGSTANIVNFAMHPPRES